MSMDQEEAVQLIADCMNRDSRMSNWEREFIDSVYAQVERGKSLSEKQAEILNTIWEKVTKRG